MNARARARVSSRARAMQRAAAQRREEEEVGRHDHELSVCCVLGKACQVECVVDVAIDAGFTSLTTAVITAELLPALTDPLAEYTVFAPTNDAFNEIATALGTDIDGLLALPNLQDILLYHVLGSEVASSSVTNGLIATPLSATNTLKLCLLYTSPSPRDKRQSRMPSSA